MRVSKIKTVLIVLVGLMVNCCNSQSNLDSTISSEKLQGLIDLIQKDGQNKLVATHCNELDSYVDRTGAVYQDMVQKNIQSSNYKNSQLLFRAFRLCTVKKQITIAKKEQISKQIQRVIKGILLNSADLDQYSTGFFEKRDNLQHLIEILTELEQMQQLIDLQEYNQKRNQYMYYVYQNRHGLVAQTEQYKQLVRTVQLGFIAERVKVQKGKNAELVIMKMDGNRMELDSSLICSSVSNNSDKLIFKQKGGKVVSDNIDMDNGVYHLECECKSIPKQPLILIVQSEVSVLQTGLIISKDNSIRQFQQIKGQYYANQDDLIKLSVTLNRADISQIYFRVAHPIYSNSTKYLAMQKDKSDQNRYIGLYDLGDPTNLLNIDGKYSLELLITDHTATQVVKKQLTTIDIKYKKALTGAALNDLINGLQYYGKQEIHHTFQQEHVFNKQIISYIVMALMVVGLIVYVSSGNCRGIFQKGLLIQTLWMLNMIAWAMLLLLFWVKINLLQYLGYAVGLMFITLFIGNAALSKFNQ